MCVCVCVCVCVYAYSLEGKLWPTYIWRYIYISPYLPIPTNDSHSDMFMRWYLNAIFFCFPWLLVVLNIFHVPGDHCISSLEKCYFFFCFLIRLFTFLIFSCMSWLYILDIKFLLVISFTKIFSNSVECLFILLMASSAVRKVLCLIRSHLSFALAYFAFRKQI